MWWPGPTAATWHEAHNSPGRDARPARGGRWRKARSAAPRGAETYVSIANTVGVRGIGAGHAAVRGRHAPRRARSRCTPTAASTSPCGAEFPEAAGRRFGAVVESLGATPAQIVVERAMYSNAGGVVWAAGTNALATKLQ